MPDRLTRKQLQALRLAAEGLSNKAIGQRMGLSPRTAEWHLQNAYRALGVSDRDEAYGLVRDRYGSLPGGLPARIEPRADQDVATAGQASRSDGAELATRGLFGIYARLGPWRTPPMPRGKHIILIVSIAMALLILLGGALAVMAVSFEVVQAIRLGGQ
ncbi:LuxR family transcriptional regulator [Brevundimonas sp. S30B]|uniref:helix-turn-helix domain-containing protein n=1 Tax=unclassified Brevundimonas TaxID=2622653 RepID=UPI001071ACFB|nr:MULTISPECIES: helix-turn-helix transcriptional regulator [unclassified Brevundimonas]QBX38116.1 LuxR family transcriptional regulator [Brevundimonas sp. MF30-B]TFW02529.1 LuxR family transcriptional regulator [Brevundimonas sp. S30B]